LSGLADQIKDGYSFSTDAKGNVVGNHAVTAVGNGKTVSYAAGDNLTITQNIDNTISSVSGDTEQIRKVIDEVSDSSARNRKAAQNVMKYLNQLSL